MSVATGPLPPMFGPVSPLPRGPHRLPRAEVAASQRTRLLRAVVEQVADTGYARAGVAPIARRAGVSPNVFYEHFADKQTCYLAAYDIFVATLLRRVGAAVPGELPWHRVVPVLLDVCLRTLDAEPAIARGFLLEMQAAGPRARARRQEAHEAIAAVAHEHHRELCRRTAAMSPLPARAYLGLVHGIRELVCDALEDPTGQPLADLAPDILDWIAATFGSARNGVRS